MGRKRVTHVSGCLDDLIPLGSGWLHDIRHSNENVAAGLVIPRHIDLGRHREWMEVLRYVIDVMMVPNLVNKEGESSSKWSRNQSEVGLRNGEI